MTPAEGLAHFAGLAPSNIKMGLDRVRLALDRVGNPERRVPAVHVAGTNGKGSTCALVASCLRQRYRTGLYTSPHLERPNERIRVDGVDIDDHTFGQRIAEVVEKLGPDHQLTYFELGTVVAFWHFAAERVEIAVLETGLGGRLDATTACAPVVTCITPISFDHMDYLGPTLASIAGEKAGILKPGVPAVISRQAPEALAVIAATQADFVLEGRDFDLQGDRYRGWSRAIEALHSPLRGPHQRQNLAVALACLEALTGFPLADDEIRRGVRDTRWPGRLEELSGSPPLVIDGAHNPAGVEALLRALDSIYPGRPISLLFGVFADKDSAPMMQRLFPRVERVWLVPLASARSKDPSSYLEVARSLNPRATAALSIAEAVQAAKAETPPDGLVLGAGSLSLVSPLRQAWLAHTK